MSKRKNVVILIVLLSISVIVLGYVYYKTSEDSIRQEKYEELKAIALLKVDQLVQWRKERNGDAFVISHSTYFVNGVDSWLNNKRNTRVAENLIDYFNTIKSKYGYKSVFLSSIKGEILLSTEDNLEKFDVSTSDQVKESFKKQNIVQSGFYFCNLEKEIHYDIIAPLVNAKGITIAAIILRVDPNDYLYPLIQQWPTNSETSETLLLRREGNSVIFLNELRHQKNTALLLRKPISNKDLPAAAAAEGYTGIFDGVDYRGVDVLSFVCPIEGSELFMVAKIDKKELLEPLYLEAAWIAGFVILLILVFSSGLSLLYNSRKKNIYKKLWDAEQEFKTILYSIGDAVITTNNVGRVQQLNFAAEQLTGWKEEEAKGKPLEEVFQILNEETMLKVENSVQKVLRDGNLVGLTNHTLVVSKNGRKIPIMESGAPIKSEDGKITGVVLVCKDQTKERKTLQLLRKNEAKYRNIFETTYEGICITDENEIIISVNQRMEEILGYKEGELLGKNFVDLLPEWELDDHAYKIKRRKKQLSESYERSLVKKNGSIIYTFVSATPQFNDEGKYNGSFGMFTDITENKQAEAEIRKLYRGVEQSPAIIIITDKNGNIEYVNPKFNEVTGYTYAEAIGANPRILKSGSKTSVEYKHMWDTILSGNDWKGEFLNKKKNGEFYWQSSAISPIKNEKGKITHFIAINEDVTEQKRIMDELIKAKEKAEEMNKIKTTFFSNMSHELRTPFIGITGYATLLKEKLNDPEALEMVTGILSSSTRLTDTLTKILDVTKLEFSKTEIMFEEINIKDVIERIYTQFIVIAEEKKLSLRKNINCEGKQILTDRKMLLEILENLVSNAIKFTNSGWVEISCEIENKNNIGELLVLKVTDTGIGIPKDKEEVIWEEFRQVSEGSTRDFQGAGLGLSIVKKYTELLGGKVYLQSSAGKGSTFILKFSPQN